MSIWRAGRTTSRWVTAGGSSGRSITSSSAGWSDTSTVAVNAATNFPKGPVSMRISINWGSSNCKLTRGSASACDEALAGKPDSGNLSLRFDEGSGLNHPLLLY